MRVSEYQLNGLANNYHQALQYLYPGVWNEISSKTELQKQILNVFDYNWYDGWSQRISRTYSLRPISHNTLASKFCPDF